MVQLSMLSARGPDASSPGRPAAFWRVIALTSLTMCAYLWHAAPTDSNPELQAEPDLERDEARTSTHTGRSGCGAQRFDPDLLRRLLAQLERARSATRRCAALRQLSAIAANNDVPSAQIARYTRRPYETNVRACAIEALGTCRSPGALERLLELSAANDTQQRLEVARALSARVEDAAQARVRMLANQVGSVWQVPACVALAESGAPEALETIAAALKDASAPERHALITALGETRDPRALELLKAILDGPSRAFDNATLGALGALGSSEATQLLMQWLVRHPSNARVALHALADSTDPSARQILLSAADGGNVQIGAEQALSVLSQSADADVHALMLGGLSHASAARRDAALEYFEAHPDLEALPALLALTNDAASLRDGRLLSALGRTGSNEAADTLERLALDENQEHAGAALRTLADMPEQHDRARELALELAERDPASAVRVLERLDPGDSAPARAALVEMTGHQGFVGRRAVHLLAGRTDPETERVLVDLARSADAPQRSAALNELASGSERGAAVVREVMRSPDSEARATAIEALGAGLGAGAEADLLAASHDRAPQVAAEAVTQLANIATPAALTRLAELVDAPDSQIVSSALTAVASDAPERVPAAVDRILASNNPDTLRGAVSSAPYLDREPATQLVERALHHSDPDLIVEAIDQLSTITDDNEELTARLRELASDRTLPSKAREYARAELENYARN